VTLWHVPCCDIPIWHLFVLGSVQQLFPFFKTHTEKYSFSDFVQSKCSWLKRKPESVVLFENCSVAIDLNFIQGQTHRSPKCCS
jgi:hypothetical protein